MRRSLGSEKGMNLGTLAYASLAIGRNVPVCRTNTLVTSPDRQGCAEAAVHRVPSETRVPVLERQTNALEEV